MRPAAGSSLIVGLLILAAPVAYGASVAKAAPPRLARAPASAPAKLEYSGSLVDATGSPVTGPTAMTFRLYDAATAGTLLWSEAQTVPVHKGVFHAMLGSVTPFPDGVFDSS